MSRQVTGRLPGRPEKKIDWAEFERMCEIHCTKDEICHLLQMDEVTLTNHCQAKYGASFSDVSKEFGASGKKSLRRRMFEIAEKGAEKNSLHACIWLSKHHLGMRDNQEDNDLKNLAPLVIKTSREIVKLGMGEKDNAEFNSSRKDAATIDSEDQ